ncbi:MAG: hypothetical protein ABFD08_04780 [Syntrophomonas sp.]
MYLYKLIEIKFWEYNEVIIKEALALHPGNHLLRGKRMIFGIRWDMVGAIGQCAGALATTAAVIVALVVARKESKVKTKVAISNGFISTSKGAGEDILTVKIINFGNKRVNLTSTGFRLPNKKDLVFPEEQTIRFPCCLELSHSTEYYITLRQINEALSKNGYKGTIKLGAYFEDTYGNRHKKNFKFTVN